MVQWSKEPIVASEGEIVSCPGCGRDVAYSVQRGWVDVFGTKECYPLTVSHDAHLEILLKTEGKT